MSDVPLSYQTRVHVQAVEQALHEGSPDLGSRSAEAILSLLRRYERMARILDSEVGIGFPDRGDGTARRSNIIGGWATATLTNTNQLGNGAGAPVTFEHNLGLKVMAVPTTGDSYPNVRVLSFMATFGDRTGANAAPAAAANQAHTSVHFLLGDAVTENDIEMRVHSGLAITATEPLTIDIFFTPAVI